MPNQAEIARELKIQSQIMRFREFGFRRLIERMSSMETIPRGKARKAVLLDVALQIKTEFSCPMDLAYRAIAKAVPSAWCRLDLQRKGGNIELRLARLRKASKEMLAVSMRKAPTPTEKIFSAAISKHFSNAGFKTQKVVFGYIPDVYSAMLKIALEVDGGYHINRTEYDRLRDERLSRAGILTVRFPADRVEKDIDGIVRELRQIVYARARLLESGPKLRDRKLRVNLRSLLRQSRKAGLV